MRRNMSADTRATQAPASAGWSDPPYYSDDLLPALQGTLAALADLELRFEIAREGLAALCESDEEKQRHRAELEQVHQQAREPLLQHLARLQEGGKPARSPH